MIMKGDIGLAPKRQVKAEFNDCHNALFVILNSPKTLTLLRTLNDGFLLL